MSFVLVHGGSRLLPGRVKKSKHVPPFLISASLYARREEQRSLEDMEIGPVLFLLSAQVDRRSPCFLSLGCTCGRGKGRHGTKPGLSAGTRRQVCPVPLPWPFPSSSAGCRRVGRLPGTPSSEGSKTIPLLPSSQAQLF